jgi:hypothetical protein
MNSLLQNGGPQPWLDAIVQHEINWSVEKVFEKQLKIHVSVEGLPFKLNDKIEITLGRLIPSSTRAKET